MCINISRNKFYLNLNSNPEPLAFWINVQAIALFRFKFQGTSKEKLN